MSFTFHRSIKLRVLFECLFEQWNPHAGRCVRGARARIAVSKMGWVMQFEKMELVILQPKAGKLVVVKRLPYFKVRSQPQSPWLIELRDIARQNKRWVFNLRQPEKGFIKVIDPPDFNYLRQFAGPIDILTKRLGRPPNQKELVSEVYDTLQRVLPMKAILKIYHTGIGLFWTCKVQGISGTGFQRRRWFFVQPGMSIAKAEDLWRRRQENSD